MIADAARQPALPSDALELASEKAEQAAPGKRPTPPGSQAPWAGASPWARGASQMAAKQKAGFNASPTRPSPSCNWRLPRGFGKMTTSVAYATDDATPYSKG